MFDQPSMQVVFIAMLLQNDIEHMVSTYRNVFLILMLLTAI